MHLEDKAPERRSASPSLHEQSRALDAFTRHLLGLFTRKETRKEYLDAVVEAIRQWSGCRCVGIRVADARRNIPYESFIGFSRGFCELEDWLSLDRDACFCVRAILQAPEPQDLPVMTPGGSFHLESAGRFVAALPAGLLARYRGTCMKSGFNTVAVVPVFYRGQPLGAIHLADEREGVVPRANVEVLESMALLIGEAIHRFTVEQELRATSQYARGLIEASLDPLVTISADGKITDVNRATESATGISRAELIGSDFSYYFTEPEKASAGYRKVLAEGSVTDYPLTIRHTSGRTTDVLYNATVYRNEAGEVQGVFAAARDVTERQRAEKALWESEQRYRSLTVATTQIVWTTNPQGEVVTDLPSWRAVTGQSAEEVKGWGWSDAVHPDDRNRVAETWSHSVASRSLYEIEYRIRRRDSQYRMFLVRGVPVLDRSGTLREWVGTCTDITERRQAEEQLARYREHLEELVARRTKDLEAANRQLEEEVAERKRAAEALARTADDLARSNRELEQFAYVASHDLQEPLRVVTGYVQLLERRYKGKFDADAEQFFHYVVDGVARMQQLITDLLDYSRVGTRGKAMEPTDAGAVLDRVLVNLGRIVAESGAVVTRDPLPTVIADDIQLGQVFQNLIGNAIKFRGERRPEIHISVRPDGSRARFSVRDNGIGIEREYRDQVFVIFQRLHTRQKYPGTGIGLAICKRIVERHGGRIWLESEPGQGTTFHFTIG